MSWNGLTVLDGGLVDNVPVHAVAGGRGKTLVLLTRHYPPGTIPRDSDRIYVQPSEPIPVSKWDYKNPEGIQATFDLGKNDGRRFLENQ
jgi:predicted patatin/cPLA2 family phospholipase